MLYRGFKIIVIVCFFYYFSENVFVLFWFGSLVNFDLYLVWLCEGIELIIGEDVYVILCVVFLLWMKNKI